MNFFDKLVELFSSVKYMESMFKGRGATVMISAAAAVLGLILGTIVAFVTIAKDSRAM